MSRVAIAVFTVLLIPLFALGAEKATPKLSAAAEVYQALLAEYEKEGGARLFSKRFLDFAKKYPKDDTAVDALLWVAKNVRGRVITTEALERLEKYHVDNKKLGPQWMTIAGSRSPRAEKLLHALMVESPHKNVQAQACFALAALYDLESNVLSQLKAQPELASRVLQYYGKDYGKHLAALKMSDLEKKQELVYTRMKKSFADVEIRENKLGEFAEKKLFKIRHLSVGKQAPEIHGKDVFGKELKLSDFRGKVVMLIFWGDW